MIIRLYETQDQSLVVERAPEESGRDFGRINLLMFTSGELRERFHLALAETDFATAFELARALTHGPDGPTDAAIDKSRVAKLLAARPALLPCFVAYQRTSEGAVVPVMTDGPAGMWSLFFDPEGRMTLVEHQSGEWRIQTQADLMLDEKAASESGGDAKGFLLNGLRSARKMLVRPEDRS